jgi:putative SOS response-associated peptidase YedK
MINAKAETVADKPAFKDAFRRQRCLVVADGFFEWRQEGKLRIPVYIRLKSQRPMGFAGLYNTWKSPDGDAICTCSIITTEANELLSPIHDRMPAIIPEDQDELWLDPNISDRDRLMPLLRPYSPDEMEYYEVSSVINKPENDSPEIIMPVKP